MKALATLLLLYLFIISSAQDSSVVKPSAKRPEPSAYQQLLKMNHTSNMMIGGGVGLCGVSAFLIYYGVTTYKAEPLPNSSNPNGDIRLNHQQGIAFLASAAVAIAGGATLITLGALRKYQFKVRKKRLGIRSGITTDGRLLLALDF